MFVYVFGRKVYSFLYQNPLSFNEPINYIFFIERTKDKEGLLKINKKEALQRIVFHSDVCFKKNDIVAEYRLKVLYKLVEQSNNFIFYNKYDLYKKPNSIKKIFSRIFK